MKVFNLGCSDGHRFEGWFASDADYTAQAERGLTACPMCGSADIQRLPSAPHVRRPKAMAPRTAVERGRPVGEAAAADAVSGAGSAARPGAGTSPGSGAAASATDGQAPGLPAALQAAHLQAMRRVLAETPDVGTQFPEEARRMHYGEAPERAIRGRATPDEARALCEEGIAVLPLVLPEALKDTLQ